MINVSVSLQGVEPKVKKAADYARWMTAQKVLSDSNFYIPARTDHTLERSPQFHQAEMKEQGKVVWDTPYARRLFYNPQYNFKHTVNPHARGMWFYAAKARKVHTWEQVAQKSAGDYLAKHT